MNRSIQMQKAGGFSLIELMIAMVAGLIVIGSVLAFTVSSMQANAINIKATRLEQELRTSMMLVSREIKRAGFDRNALNSVGSGVYIAPYGTITVSGGGDCLVMAYDRVGVLDTQTAPGATEVKAFRRTTVGTSPAIGVIQVNLTEAAPSCTSASAAWVNITNPLTVDVTSLRFVSNTTVINTGTNPTTGAIISVTIRNVGIAMAGTLVNDNTVTRNLVEQVRVRSNIISG